MHQNTSKITHNFFLPSHSSAMTRLQIYFIIIVALAVIFTTCTLQCNFPQSLWCTSKNIAELCEATEYCKKNVWDHYIHKPAKPVSITVYMESLCPDCKDFFLLQLWPTWLKVGPIMDLKLVPYGNAQEVKTSTGWNFTCQHGPDECYGNILQTCSISIEKNISIYLPFINCLELSDLIPRKMYPECARKYGLNPDTLKKCADGPLGIKLEHEMAQLTNRLDPPNDYVPWVTLNGIHTKEIQEQAEDNLTKLVCDSYKGRKPDICSER